MHLRACSCHRRVVFARRDASTGTVQVIANNRHAASIERRTPPEHSTLLKLSSICCPIWSKSCNSRLRLRQMEKITSLLPLHEGRRESRRLNNICSSLVGSRRIERSYTRKTRDNGVSTELQSSVEAPPGRKVSAM
jgi:hypothetical protein